MNDDEEIVCELSDNNADDLQALVESGAIKLKSIALS